MQHPRALVQVIAAAGGSGEVIERPVTDRHPLGQAGRARGEHQVGDGAAGGRLVEPVVAHQIPGQESAPLEQAGQLVAILGLGDQGLDLAQAQYMALALQRLLGVERHVDGARQQHSQLGEDGLGRAGQHDADPVPRLHAGRLQSGRHLFRSGQQRLVADARLPLHQGNLVRGLGGEVAERVQHRAHLDHFVSRSRDHGSLPLPGQPIGLEGPQGLGGRGEPAGQQGEQSIGDGHQLGLLVAAGVGVQIQSGLTISPHLHLYGEILHRPGADVEDMGTERPEAAGVIERHDIDQGAEQSLVAPHQAKVAAQQLVAIVLVLAHAALGLGHGAGRPRQIQFFTERQRQRGDVHLHAGHCQGGRPDAVHHHQAKQRLLLATGKGELGREAGQQQIGPTQLVLVGKAGQGLPERRRQGAALANKFGGDGRAGLAKGFHLGPALQLLLPEAAGGSVLAALLADQLFGQYLIQQAKRRWRRHSPCQPFAIEFGDTLEQQGGAKAV